MSCDEESILSDDWLRIGTGQNSSVCAVAHSLTWVTHGVPMVQLIMLVVFSHILFGPMIDLTQVTHKGWPVGTVDLA